VTDYLGIFRRARGPGESSTRQDRAQAAEARQEANGPDDRARRNVAGRRPTLKELGELYGVQCSHGYVGGVGCFLCDLDHPFRVGKNRS